MATGLRIDDVLSLRPRDLRTQRPTVRERKTRKTRRVYLPNDLYELLLAGAGRYWVFPGRIDPKKHRSRQAVWKDLRRVAKLYRIDGKPVREHVSPHTGRKIYAVHDLAEHGGDLRRVQRDLNHADPAMTALYAFADRLTEVGKVGKKRGNHTKRVEKKPVPEDGPTTEDLLKRWAGSPQDGAKRWRL